MKPLDLTKPLQTRDGRPAKFLHKLDTPNQYPVTCVVNFGIKMMEFTGHFTELGEHNAGSVSKYDLINVPVKHVREYWVNLYRGRLGAIHTSKPDSDSSASHDRIACKKITIEFEEGEGLDGFKESNQERWDEVVKK